MQAGLRHLGLLLILLFFATVGFAQSDRATLTGTVLDPSGAVVPGAEVELTSPATGFHRDLKTGSSGSYTFAGVPIGDYNVQVSFTGFNPVTVKNVHLGVGDNRALDITFQEVAGGTTVVSVTGEAQALDRESAAIGTVIDGKKLREIPINGRHWASLMLLAPGAVNSGVGDMGDIRFAGRSNDDNNFQFDGIDASGVKDQTQEEDLRLTVSQDSIEEFRVNSSLYSAESGTGGGAQVNLVSKGGTNDWHGGAFEFFRNDRMDARNPFDDSRQPFRLNQFGASVGGPIVKNKTFFFANYEGLRQRVSETYRSNVPSAAFRAKATNPAILQILNSYPTGTRSSGDKEGYIDWFDSDRGNAWTEDSGMLRIDHRINDFNSIYARFSTDNGQVKESISALPNDDEIGYLRPTNFVVQYQHLFTPTVVNEFKAGVNRVPLNRYPQGPFAEEIVISGFQTLNDANHQIEIGTSYSLIDSLAITKGKHTLKMGTEIRRAHVNVADPLYPTRSVNYASRADFLINKVNSVSIGSGNAELGIRKWFTFGYIQDDIKITPQLTMNLGLRYEYYGVSSEAYDRYRVFDFWECKGYCADGTPWYFPDRNNFDPRFGLAWSPKALKGKTVIRMGGGIFHGPGQIDDSTSPLDNYATNYSLTRNEANLSYPITPFLGLAKEKGITPRSMQRDRRDLYSAQWGLSIQQQLPAGFMTQVGYSGSTGKKLFARIDINRLDLVSRTRMLPNFGRIDEKRQDGNSNFNALQISLHRRMATGLTWGTEYMWSHSINDGSTGAGEGDRPQNSDCRACDRASGAYDIRQTFTSFWTYELPFGQGKKFVNNGPAARILGGWELSGMWAMRTGRSLNISMSRSTSYLPDGNSRNPRPNYVEGVSIYPDDQNYSHWLNINAFSSPASRVWGNLGRLIARGPGMAQVDFSIQKTAHLTESKALIFRVEAFNMFNRTQAGNPGTSVGSQAERKLPDGTIQYYIEPNASFGVITGGLNRTIGTGTARQLQLALRFRF